MFTPVTAGNMVAVEMADREKTLHSCGCVFFRDRSFGLSANQQVTHAFAIKQQITEHLQVIS